MQIERPKSRKAKKPKKQLKATCNLELSLFSNLTISDPQKLETFLRRQLEFYFSDANLRRDKFMREQILANKKGSVPLSLFTKFNRIQTAFEEYHIPRNESIKNLAAAVEKSEVLRLNEQKNMVKRIDKFDFSSLENPEVLQESVRKSVYIDGFAKNCSEREIYERLSNFGEIACIDLPKYKSGKNKGFAFVEFAEEQGARNFLSQKANLSKAMPKIKSGNFSGMKFFPKAEILQLQDKLKEVG